jgi:hypothetical protein
MNHAEAIAALSAADNWHKATFSGGANSGCVEVATVPGYIGVRDTKLGETSPVLAFTPVEWQAFLDGVRAGEFEV